MSNEKNREASVNTGSADNLIQADPTVINDVAGESVKASEVEKLQKQYMEAEKKIGEQGKELGDFRNFFEEVSPLIDKLQEQPELVEAIMAGQIDAKLAQAVLDNKVKIEDATIVTDAHNKVKAELGKKEYSKTSPVDIEKMINEKISEISNDFKKNIKSSEDRRQFEKSVENFISETSDFATYAEDITTWLDKHPDIYDIETAYYAVKGRVLADEKAKENVTTQGEAAKLIAANAGAGGSLNNTVIKDEKIVDALIAPISNPNSFN